MTTTNANPTLTNASPALPTWAMEAIRELVDIAGLLNDEMFLAVEALDAKQTIVQRLQALAESITLDGEPLALEGD